MHCTNCGFAIPAEAAFCAGCGSPVGTRPAPAPAYQAAVPFTQSGFGPPAPYGLPAQQYAPAAAGYPAPYGPVRYSGAPADHGPGTATHWLLPVGRSWQSIAAGYLALFAIIVWPLGPFALGLGVWALVRSAREKAHGTGRAVFAVIVGLLATFLLFAVLLPH